MRKKVSDTRFRKARAKFQPEIVDYRSIPSWLMGDLIVARRRYHALNQLELSTIVGITPAAMCRIEKGQTTPHVTTLAKICKALQCTLQQLIYPVEPELADNKKAALAAHRKAKHLEQA